MAGKSHREGAALLLYFGLVGQKGRALIFRFECLKGYMVKTLYMVGEDNIYSSSFDVIDSVDGLFSGCSELKCGLHRIYLVTLINCI